MNLRNAIENVALTTARLQEALATGDLTRAAAAVQERADLLEDLRACHMAAGTQERAECALLMHELQDQDDLLQRLASASLAKVDRQRGERAGSGMQPSRRSDVRTGCLDRKA